MTIPIRPEIRFKQNNDGFGNSIIKSKKTSMDRPNVGGIKPIDNGVIRPGKLDIKG